MMPTNNAQSLRDIAHAIDAGSLAPQDAISRCYDSIEAGDAEIRAFVTVDRTASAAAGGPLRGIAGGVKDIIDTAALPTGMGSPIYDGWQPKADASVVAALRAAGATIVGKTETTAFAHSDPTPTRNPWRAGHTPGGSSSGSAAAVAAGMVPLAIGTQTGGSTIRPASYCGVAAIRPTFGLIPTVGVKCLSWSLDAVGLFGRGIADIAQALQSITGGLAPVGAASGPIRIGVLRQEFAGDAEDASVRALERAAAAIEGPAALRDIRLAPVFAEAWHAHLAVQDFEARQALAWELAHEAARLSPVLLKAMRAAESIDRAAYVEAQQTAAAARTALASILAEVDVLMTYSAPGTAPATLATTGDAKYNRLWSLMGGPCINVPGLFGADGLPVGIQVVGAAGQDIKALDVAGLVEARVGEFRGA